MPAIKPVPYQTLAKIFESEGFTLHRQRGDHLIYSKPEVKRPLVIPMYSAVPVFIIKPAFLTGFRREESETPSEQGARPEGTGGVLDGTSRSPTKRNAALADGSGAVADNS